MNEQNFVEFEMTSNRPDIEEALKDVRLVVPGKVYQRDLQEAQLREYPDSFLLSVGQALKIMSGIADSKAGAPPWRWMCVCLAYLEEGPIQFYLCGRQPDGRYQWMGMRFGIEGHEYMSGCPLNNIKAPEET